MGMSMTQEQSKTLEALHDAERKQAGWKESKPGSFFFDGPHGRKDYGIPGRMNMSVAIMEMIEGNLCRHFGYATIRADGTYAIPRRVREAMGL